MGEEGTENHPQQKEQLEKETQCRREGEGDRGQ